MALLPANKRDQYMMLVVIAAIGLSAAYFTYLWSPKKEELDVTQAHVDSLVIMTSAPSRSSPRARPRSSRPRPSGSPRTSR